MKNLLLASAAASALMLSAAAAQAQMVTALVGKNTLATFDAKTGKKMSSTTITGMPGGIAGIDVRPADGMLYALGTDGTVATIDTKTGKATPKAKLDKAVPKGAVTVDFNPMADRLRVIGTDGTNLRANVDDGKTMVDGKLAFKADDAAGGKKAKVVAGAYTNSVKGTTATVLYDIDASGSFLRQAPPNDGVLNTLGTLGMKADKAAFDILSNGTENWAFLASGKSLYMVDIASGKASKAADLEGVRGGSIRDIAVWAN
jgi:hypothetical protein